MISVQVAHNGVFGVGAPEALLVGIVALVVFGPQGLIDVRSQAAFVDAVDVILLVLISLHVALRASYSADPQCQSILLITHMQAAKTVASTIRSVQPAIQELNQATTEIRTSITKEVGIDSITKEFREIEQTTRDSLRLDRPSFSPPVPDATPVVLTGVENKDVADKEVEKDGGGVQSNGAATSENGAAEGFSEEERKSLTAIAEGINKDEEQKENGDSAEGGEDIEKMRAESAAMAWGDSTASESGTGKSVKKRLEDMTMAELTGELARRKEMIERINNLN